MPEAQVMKKVRQEIDYCFDEFNTIVSAKQFKSIFGELYTGEDVKLSRVPRGFEKDNPAAEYLKFKSWLVISHLDDETVLREAGVLMRPTVKVVKTDFSYFYWPDHESDEDDECMVPGCRLNGKRHHEHWLPILMASTSLMGFRNPKPAIR